MECIWDQVPIISVRSVSTMPQGESVTATSATPIGVYSQAFIQGLYGVLPDAMNDKLVVRPGFPAEWKAASLKTATVDFNFRRDQQTDYYTIIPSFEREMTLTLQLKSHTTGSNISG